MSLSFFIDFLVINAVLQVFKFVTIALRVAFFEGNILLVCALVGLAKSQWKSVLLRVVVICELVFLLVTLRNDSDFSEAVVMTFSFCFRSFGVGGRWLQPCLETFDLTLKGADFLLHI